ncbi:protein P200 isoform X2 [Zeugodacus cucurbitae]|uniref:protein P200 isoform X2 n=1 Tax=Zeugodacus cucurbitae TaxID=28588 RepID=UPI0023D95AA0|nr:protein P200 isoform X2 [Zeugodacus cucurbitae]
MCAGRSKMFQNKFSTRLAFYAIALLLLSCATQRASSMSLERLGVDQNDLNSASLASADHYEEQTETDNAAADIVGDDRELEAVPTSGNTDTYLLVPAGGAAERESVEKNTIESAGDSNGAAEEPQPNEATDMLMVESNDAPMHVSFLAVPVEQSELVDGEQVANAEEIINDDESANDEQVPDLADKILEIPAEPELQEVVPVVAEEVPLASIEKLDTAAASAELEHDSHNEDTVSAEHETIADMIADAVLEVEKDMESAQLSDELPSNVVPVESEIVEDSETNDNKNEEAAEQDAIESLSAMEEELLPEVVSVPVEAVHIEQENSEDNNEPLLVSDSKVEDVNVEENEIKEDEANEQTPEHEISEDLVNKPEDIIVNVEPVAEEIVAIQPEITNEEDNQSADESIGLSDTIVQMQSEENAIAQSNSDAENTNAEGVTKEEENASVLMDEIKADTSEVEVNPVAEAIEKEVEANLAEMIAEDNKVEETIAKEPTPNEAHEEQNKQDDEITEDKHVEETQMAEEAQQTENDQVAEESQTAEESQAVEESQTAEELQTVEESQAPEETQAAAETEAFEGDQLAEETQITEDNKEQETNGEDNVEAEKVKPEAVNNQLDEISQDAAINEENLQEANVENLAEETLPVGEVAKVATQEDTHAEEIPQQETTAEDVKEDNKLEDPASEDIKQDAPIVEETQPEEIKEEQMEPQLPEASSQLSEAEQQPEVTYEELQETAVNEAEVNEDATQNASQQITVEKLEEESTPTKVETAPETQELVEEKLEEVQNPTEIETQPEAQNLEEPQVKPSVELVQEEEQKPEATLELVENQEEQEQQQQEEAQDTTAEELQQQTIEEEAQEAQPQESQPQAVEEVAQDTPTEEVQQQVEQEETKDTLNDEVQQQAEQEEAQETLNVEVQLQAEQEEAQETLNEEVQQQAVEEEAQETQPELPQQQTEEQQQPESEPEVEQQPLKETEIPEEQVEEHLEEEVMPLQEPVEQLKQEESVIPQQPQQQTSEEQPQIEAQTPVAQQILADEPAEVPTEIATESQNTGPIEPTNSLLTTIIQVPQQQAAPVVKVENDEAPLTPTLVSVNNPPAAAAAPTVAPLNVMDSVLNYVNASFMQLNANKQQQQQLTTQNLKDDDDDNLNAQLRRYDGAQVWRIVVQSDHDRKMADELQTKYGGQLWKEVKQEVDYLLKPQVLADAAQHVRAANLSRIVLIDNLQNVIETENPSAAEIAQYQNRKGHRLTWKAYHRLDDIHGFFDTMAKTYPDICSVETIGYSLQKRPLKILKISNGNPGNPGVWIDGGMHAREWISPATVTYIANQLIEDWENLPDYMRNVNWYIHAVANPDGYEYTHTTDRLWRKNMRSHGRQCPGVDLNRNFGYKWGGKGTSANPCSQTYRGSKAFSEPETFYISKFISNQPRGTFQAYLSFHSYGQYILYPWGYDYHLTADKADLDRVARQAGTTITKKSGGKYTVGSSATTLYPAAGGSDDWAKGFAGIKYAYTIELGDTGRYGFVLPASHIEPNGSDGYIFAETVARAITQGNKYSRKRAL